MSCWCGQGLAEVLKKVNVKFVLVMRKMCKTISTMYCFTAWAVSAGGFHSQVAKYRLGHFQLDHWCGAFVCFSQSGTWHYCIFRRCFKLHLSLPWKSRMEMRLLTRNMPKSVIAGGRSGKRAYRYDSLLLINDILTVFDLPQVMCMWILGLFFSITNLLHLISEG